MKPIVRWTIGDVSKEGIECLNLSIKNFIRLYEYKFEYYVCHNNIDLNKLDFLKNYNIKLLNQENYKESLSIPPIDKNPCWKLYPPRINKNVHEIFIDNDLIIHKKIPLIDEFLESEDFLFITAAFKKSYGTIESDVNLNSGFFGLFPKFDFENQINFLINFYNLHWENSIFEEQSLVAKIISSKKFKIISTKDIQVCYESLNKSNYGFHFVGLNNEYTKFWFEFIKKYKNKLL